MYLHIVVRPLQGQIIAIFHTIIFPFRRVRATNLKPRSEVRSVQRLPRREKSRESSSSFRRDSGSTFILVLAFISPTLSSSVEWRAMWSALRPSVHLTVGKRTSASFHLDIVDCSVTFSRMIPLPSLAGLRSRVHCHDISIQALEKRYLSSKDMYRISSK